MIEKLRTTIHGWAGFRRAQRVVRPVFFREELTRAGYHSQCGQDKWIVETLMPRLRDGIFVDVGAHDGISFSNTVFLEKELGWTGLAIEPIPEVFALLQRNRQCVCINGCVAGTSGKARFRRISGYSEMLSGLVEEYDPRHEERILKEESLHGGSHEEIEVKRFVLNDLLQSHGITHVDYLSIDTEGAEVSILKSIDWGRFEIAVIGVENNYSDLRISGFLSTQGYQLHSVVGDEFYVRQDNPDARYAVR